MDNSYQPALFRNVPPDYLHLFNRGEPEAKKITNLLGYGNRDIADAANIPLSSVRYDEKMPSDLKERLIEWALALNLVATFFQDRDKTILWFKTPNPLLAYISPKDMIRVGRFKKLIKFIQTALDENQR